MSAQPQLFEEYKNDADFRAEMILAEIAMDLSEVIEQLRINRDLTQAQLAELINTKQSQVSRMENAATARFTLKTLAKISDALNCKLEVKLIESVEACKAQPVTVGLSPLQKYAPQMIERIMESATAVNNVIDFTAKRKELRACSVG